MKYYLLTAFGRDRVGIVRDVTEILYKFNLNIDDSSMIRLNNEFTIMLILEDNNNCNMDILKEEFKRVEKKNSLEIFIKEIEKTGSFKKESNIYNIIAYGEDKVGIIYKISKLLTEHNINIINLFTEKEESLYVVIIKVEVEKKLDIENLKKGLNDLKKELALEINISEEIEEVEM